MPEKRHAPKSVRALSGEVGPGDGIDPKERERTSSRTPGPRRAKGPPPAWVRLPNGEVPPPAALDRKAQQLCRQVARTLDALFAGETRNEALRGLKVLSVTPAPDASHLRVTVEPPPSEEPRAASDVLAGLARASSWLRAEVAAAITRKRAPNLSYHLAPPQEPRQVHQDARPGVG